MSWTVSATGHANDKDQEAETVNKLREAFLACEATSATMFSQHHGRVDLLNSNTAEEGN